MVRSGKVRDMTEDEQLGKLTREAWWKKQSLQDCDDFEKKRAEYGSFDLEMMGHAMDAISKNEGDGYEQALGFYLLGKVSRVFGAWHRGEMPSDDTLKDLVTYAMMMRLHRFEKELAHESAESISLDTTGPVAKAS